MKSHLLTLSSALLILTTSPTNAKEVEKEAPKKMNFTKWLNPIELLAQGRRTLEDTFLVVTGAVPKTAQTAQEIFSEGVLYSRLRMNSFLWDYKDDADMDHYGVGLGGKLMFASAPYRGFSGVAAVHYTNSPFRALREDDKEDIQNLRAVQDTFSRYRAYTQGDYSMAVLSQLNFSYEFSQTKLTLGRQLFESLLVSANDTKMIPNVFEGGVLEFNELSKTSLRGAYFTSQKLRDHVTFHDVITYGDGSSDPKAHWKNNDDSAAHKGLSYANLQNADKKTKNSLIVLDLKNDSIENLQIDFAYTLVPNLVSSIVAELNYKVPLIYGLSITPGVRHMQQMDNGGGDIGGASLQGSLAVDQTPNSLLGYKERYTLNGSATMGRLIIQRGYFITQFSYSKVADQADLVAPWRGFPTGGYTRAMGQYNWHANTESTAIKIFYDFSSSNLIPGFSAITRYVVQDFDEQKQRAGGQADSKILHMDFRQEILEGFDAKFRVLFSDAKRREDYALNSALTERDSYSEYRFELNYLF